MKPTLTVIIPCFNEEEVIRIAYDRVRKVLDGMTDVESFILFINDGSRDKTPLLLEAIAAQDDHAQVMHFSRNFGHQAALSAGMKMCQTEYAAVLDADMQDPPEVLPGMWRTMQAEQANVVYGLRNKRPGESAFKLWSAKTFYRTLNKISDSTFPVDVGDFRIIDRKVMDVMNGLGEHNKYIRGLISWMGFKQVPYSYDREKRVAGTTKYPLKKMLKLALNALLYNTDKPLKLVSWLGLTAITIAIVLGIWFILGKIFGFTHPEAGWTSIVTLILFFGGIQLVCIDLISRYIGSIFEEVKNRPEYIIASTTNMSPGTQQDERTVGDHLNPNDVNPLAGDKSK